MPSAVESLYRLRAGFEVAGYQIVYWQGTFPCQVVVRDESGAGELSRYSIFLHPLELREPREGSTYAWVVPSARKSIDVESRLLTLGYQPDLDVFAGWPAHDAGDRRRERLWVPWRALNEAAETGFAEPLTSSIAFAFRPEEVRHYLRIHSRPPREPGAVRRAGRRFETRWSPPRGLALPRDMHLEREEGLPAGRREGERERPEVETGLSSPAEPTRALSRFTPLEPECDYLFWFGIGTEMGGSIETTPVPPPENLPEGAILTVQLFAFDEEIELKGPTGGQIELDVDGRSNVVRAAGDYRDERGDAQRLLFFLIRTPKSEGEQRFRCNLYYGSTLLQSRLVTCRVGAEDGNGLAVSSEIDYAIASLVNHEVLARVPMHDLSVMVNGGGLKSEPTHEFRFFHADDKPLVASASLLAAKLGNAIKASRGTLRQASWETKEEWDGKRRYRYESQPGNRSDFEEDLIRMGIEGHRLYMAITRKFDDEVRRDDVADVIRGPCRIQITASDSGLYVPAALFYDHPLETSPAAGGEISEFRLCAEFTQAAAAAAPLENIRCMEGDCPNRENRRVVCPSGFWGYRHEIGWPVGAGDPITDVYFDGRARLAIGVSTDPKLKFREDHVRRVLALGTGTVAESREAFRDLAKADPAHLVYFYCHGGLTSSEGMPFLELGPRNSPGLDSPYLVDEEIRWGEPPPRPIVFINGCRTTALDPESLADLVGGFVEDANAIGVLGTEITVFEPLACDFAESVLGHFLNGSMTIGAAIRRSRLDLLRARNPLGLVYVPFVAAATRLVSDGHGSGVTERAI